jgi:hypothetical protein
MDELTVAKSIIVKGDCTINGTASCDTFNGVTNSVPVIVTTPVIALTAAVSCGLVSPIAGRIKTAYITPVNAAVSEAVAGEFYTGDGVKATTELDENAINKWYPYPIDFDWTDENDLAFCSVGIGTPFYFLVTDGQIVVDITVSARIVPFI